MSCPLSHLSIFVLSVAPVITPFAFESSPMNAGGFTMLHCTVPLGDLPLNITWAYPRPGLASVRQVADRIAMLTIESLSAYHAGDYTCHASNDAGTATHMATLLVNGALKLFCVCTLLLFFFFSSLPNSHSMRDFKTFIMVKPSG